MRFTDMDATKFSHSASLKTYFMVHDVIMMEAGTVPGYVFLFDTSGCGLGHVSRIRLSCLKTYADYTQVSTSYAFCYLVILRRIYKLCKS